MQPLHPRLRAELEGLRKTLVADGTLKTSAQLQRYYDNFRREFGPEVLRSLDGTALLEKMHAHGGRESLVYWLEFKDDDVFPAIFGSISGGSALKFGVYRRAESGTWAKGQKNQPFDISESEAIEIARQHRDQLLAGVDVVASFQPSTSDDAYLELQRKLDTVAPDVADTVWGHKYFCLLAPTVLDDYHVGEYQRYHLARLLQLPPKDGDAWAGGRYVCAGRFVALAQELDVPLQAVGTLLNKRNGNPRYCYRIATTDDPAQRRKLWELMRDNSVIVAGWPEAGDLSNLQTNEASRRLVSERLHARPDRDNKIVARQLLHFASWLQLHDRVVAFDGQTNLGIGEVSSEYSYAPDEPYPHRRAVTWRSLAEWKGVDAEPLKTIVGQIKDPRNVVEIERRILDDGDTLSGQFNPPRTSSAVKENPARRGPLERLGGVPGTIQSILDRKGQVILYGPPGTGKTYWALRAARDLAAMRWFNKRFADLPEDDARQITEGTPSWPAAVRLASFHPEYSYEDFIEGYRPRLSGTDKLGFTLEPGIFRRVCEDAAADSGRDYYLLIDEINRGDIPRIFGELLTLLEKDKRGEPVRLAVSGETFRVPPNLFLIGTMNTADRSIALLDVALRRRFGFVELMPDYSALKNSAIQGLPLGRWLELLNERIRKNGTSDARNRQVGHAFFMVGGNPVATQEQFAAIVRDEIVPLLEDYAYDDFDQLAQILGSKLVDLDQQRLRKDLFELERATELVAALMWPELATAAATVSATAEAATDDAEEPAEDQ